MEVAPGIHCIEGRFGGRYLLQHALVGERVLLVDTGVAQTPEELIFPYLESIGRRPSEVDYVLCTHPDTDHYGGNAAVKRASPACRILGHELDVHWLEDPDAMVAERYDGYRADHGVGDPVEVLADLRALTGDPVPVDVALTGGEWIRLAGDWRVQVLHAPGHSEGHLAVWDPRSRTLVVADAAMGRALPFVDGTPALAATYTHPGSYAATSAMLAGRDADLLLTAHFPAMRGEQIEAFFADTCSLVAEVEAAILETIEGAESPPGLAELIEAVDARVETLPAETRATWASPVVGHLDELEAAGRIEAAHNDSRKLYRPGRRESNAA